MSIPPRKPLLTLSIFPLTCRTRRTKGPSRNDTLPRTTMPRLARRTLQSEHTCVLPRNGILSRMTAIRFGRRTRRGKRARNPL